MNDSSIFRFCGGIAAILTALFVLAGNLLAYINEPVNGVVAGKILLFAAHILVIFVFAAVFERHSKEGGFLAGSAMIFGIIGTVIASAFIFLEIAGAAGVSMMEIKETQIIKIFSVVGFVFFIAALFFLGMTIAFGRMLSRWGGWLIILGTIVFILGSFETELTSTLVMIQAAFIFGGFFLTGATLLRNKNGSELFIKRSF